MTNATEASKIVRNLVASGQIRNYRRSKWHERRRKGGYVRKYGGARCHRLSWVIACVLWAILGAAWVAL